jgi:hypothetical protein
LELKEMNAFETDAYDVIKEMMNASASARTLDRAARLAGEQLELMKPAAVAPTSERGIYIGPVAYVNRGYVALVIADAERVMTIRFAPKCTASLLQEMADHIKEFAHPNSWGPASSAVVAKDALQRYGARPGKKGPECNQEISANVAAAMFAYCSAKQLRDIGSKADEFRRLDVCPAFVCLVGPGSSGKPDTHAIATMMLPLAPYVESAIDAAA